MIESQADLHSLVEAFFSNSFSTDNPLITEAVRRMLAAGGKRLRPRTTLLAASACGADPREHLHLAAFMELIHVATLIHDDVVDRADTRRGVNATAVDFGNKISVLAGDYLFAWIFKNVTASYPAPIPHILSATLADICDGEVLQLRALGNLDVGVPDYIDVARKKTASLFAASAACGALAAGGDAASVEALRSYGEYFGIAFQMLDDLLDVCADEATIGKPVGNDLAEHKMTIPLILALRDGNANFSGLVERMYKQDDASVASEILTTIRENGALDATRAQIAAHVDLALGALAPLGPSPAHAELIALATGLLA